MPEIEGELQICDVPGDGDPQLGFGSCSYRRPENGICGRGSHAPVELPPEIKPIGGVSHEILRIEEDFLEPVRSIEVKGPDREWSRAGGQAAGGGIGGLGRQYLDHSFPGVAERDPEQGAPVEIHLEGDSELVDQGRNLGVGQEPPLSRQRHCEVEIPRPTPKYLAEDHERLLPLSEEVGGCLEIEGCFDPFRVDLRRLAEGPVGGLVAAEMEVCPSDLGGGDVADFGVIGEVERCQDLNDLGVTMSTGGFPRSLERRVEVLGRRTSTGEKGTQHSCRSSSETHGPTL